MNIKQILAIILLCIFGSFVAQLIPNQYKYIFGYTIATLVSLLCEFLGD